MSCVHCGQLLPEGSRHDRRYCSDVCKSAAAYRRAKADGRGLMWRRRYQERARRKPESSTCRRCGSEFSQTHKRAFCTKTCRNRFYHEKRQDRPEYRTYKRRSADRRRAHTSGVDAEDLAREDIFERDGWRCHLCGKRTRRNADPFDPQAPTLDHLVPLSLGGTHTRANVATACRSCNTRKSNRGTGDQLALIG